jgi:hypothetical protein
VSVAWSIPGASSSAASWSLQTFDAAIAALTWGDQTNAVTGGLSLFPTARKGARNIDPYGSIDALMVIYGNALDNRYGC